MARLNHLTDRGIETQRLLSDVLMELIAEKDYDKISVKDITSRAGIDRTTFYLHYEGKDDLLIQTQRQVMDEFITYGKNSSRPYPVATLAFEHMAQHPRSYRMMFKLARSSGVSAQLNRQLEALIQPWIAEMLAAAGAKNAGAEAAGGAGAEAAGGAGTGAESAGAINETDLRLITQFVLGAMVGVASWWLDANMPYPPEEMGRRFVQMIRDGVGRKAGAS
jgi:AcrR family transcriptional regulator